MSATTSAAAVTGAPAAAETSSSMPRVLGVDLSLTGTGIAGADWAETIGGGSLAQDASRAERWARLRRLRARLASHLDGADLVVLEAPAYSKNDPSAHERAYLWWWVIGRCLGHEVPIAVVAPNTLKVYATGDGRASKEDVVQQVQRRRPGLLFRGNDQADALTLAAMGLDQLGHPVAELPQTHRRALASVDWPEVTR